MKNTNVKRPQPKKPRPPKRYNSAGIPIEGEREPRQQKFPGGGDPR